MLIGFAATALSACGSPDKSGKDAEQPEASVKPPQEKPNSDPVKLVFYSTAGWSQEAFNERFGDAMRKKFPNYEIEYIVSGSGTTFPDLLAAGQQIDVYWQAADVTVQHLLEYKLQYDMTPLIEKHGLNLSTLEPSSIDAIRAISDGKMYALPLVINTIALYYNKDIFDKFGVPYPSDGMTWEQVIDTAKRMRRTDGGQEFYGLGTSFTHHLNLNPLSVAYVDHKTETPTILTDPRWRTIYTILIEAYKTTDFKSLGPTQFIKDQNIAMSEGLANLYLNNDMTKMNWDMVSYPTYTEAPNSAPQPYPTLFGITSISKFKDEAMEVLKYMLSEEAQKSLSERAVIPVLQTDSVMQAFGKGSLYADKNLKAVLNRKFAPMPERTKYDAKATPLHSKPLVELAKGTMDMNTAFRQIDEEMKKMIAEEKAK
jgi:multiple sugar transport system substrate-binding protein